METLSSYVCGEWREGAGTPARLVNPATEEPVARTSTEGLDFAAAARYAREVGGPALREMTFAERGALLKSMAKALSEHRDELLDLAIRNGGNTKGDAKFDVDGASGTLFAYAGLAKSLPESPVASDGPGFPLAKDGPFGGRHLLVPREGVAVLINAFNFPAWGFGEKTACALLAGMPVLVKPATSTALVTWRMVRVLDEAGVLPEGAVQLVAGSCGDLLSHLTEQDVVSFTGSAATGYAIRSREDLLRRSVPVNVEADSLNSAVLGPGAGAKTRALFLRDVLTEMTQKAGQKCTAVRRILVPREVADEVQEELAAALGKVVVGDPSRAEVGMGPLSTAAQLRDARSGIVELAAAGRIVTGGPDPVEAVGVEPGKGYFVAPTLLRVEDPEAADVVHRLEVFGPVASVLPYDGTPGAAAALVRRGEGSLVSSVYSEDADWLRGVVRGLAAWHGRLTIGTPAVAGWPFGPGAVHPLLRHGGPGRAGGGSELGGLEGLKLYQQRVALQGDRELLEGLFPSS
jgi:oxepin-CoA hydrolase/3-oxo-5,6-dehydrosuberyl-CoA semialdehyde dehydrogenase